MAKTFAKKMYSNEQVDRAKSVDLVSFLQSRGETLKHTGSEYKWVYRDSAGEHDSVMVKGNKWFDHKNQQGGDSIGFLQEFMGLSFTEAVGEILCGEQGNQDFNIKKQDGNAIPIQTKKDFALPEQAQNMRKLYAYLTKTRFIDPDVITAFVKAKSLFQESKHDNIVFLGLDEKGVAQAGQKKSTRSFGESYKGTITGSDTSFGFGHKGHGEKLYVFEAPIDLMSYLTIYKNNWQEQNYIALDGLSPKAMVHFLENNPQIKEVNICVDHDEAGIEALDKFKDLLIEKFSYEAEQVRFLPPIYKDWNEMLKAENGLKATPSQAHPKIESYCDNIIRLTDFHRKTEQSYGQRFSEMFTENGMPFLSKSLNRQFEKYQQTVEVGKIARLKGENTHGHLLSLANICLMGTAETSGISTDSKSKIYNETVAQLLAEYKPYLDKGKLKNHCDALDKAFVDLKLELSKPSTSDTIRPLLKDFAHKCLCATVYIETKYEQDLAQQEALLSRFDDPQMSMQM